MRCGVGDYIARLGAALAHRDDLRVGVLTGTGAQPWPGTQSAVDLLPAGGRWLPQDLPSIIGAIRKWRPDVLHLQYPALGFGSRILPLFLQTLSRALGVPVVETWHEYYPSGAWRGLYHAGFRGEVIVVRPRYEDQMPRWYRTLLRRKRFHFIPNASAIGQARLGETERGAVRAKYAPDDRRMVAYFGFLYPSKGAEQLFEIADPRRDHLVIVGQLTPGDLYHESIIRLAGSEPWAGRVTLAGFLPADMVARVLAAADAVVLPFRQGGGNWNTSLHGAIAQGTYVVTTSRDRTGYDDEQHVHYAVPDDVAAMREALSRRISQRRDVPKRTPEDEWQDIARAHRAVYGQATAAARRTRRQAARVPDPTE
jgi:glycosyltransferase involved in cell wall biosynthesis